MFKPGDNSLALIGGYNQRGGEDMPAEHKSCCACYIGARAMADIMSEEAAPLTKIEGGTRVRGAAALSTPPRFAARSAVVKRRASTSAAIATRSPKRLHRFLQPEAFTLQFLTTFVLMMMMTTKRTP